jgi:DsbC/DsbD-like thiol-disulfide interchange protein
MLRRLVLSLMALLAPSIASAAADPARYMPAELIAATLDPAPGSTVLVGIRMTPRAGWHGYWSNPGDSGIATTVRWSAPGRVSFGPLLHPAPTLLSADGIDSYVHEGEHILLAPMRVPASLVEGAAVPIVAHLNWAACTATQCVPLRATLRLDLTAGRGSRSAEWVSLHRAAERLPRAASGGTFVREGKSIRLRFPRSLGLRPRTTHFFAEQPEAFDTAGGRVEQSDGALIVGGSGHPGSGQPIAGVATDGRAAYRLVLRESEEPLQPPAARPTDARMPMPGHEEMKAEAKPPSNAEAAPRNPQSPPQRRRSPWLALAAAVALLAAALAVLVRRRSRR